MKLPSRRGMRLKQQMPYDQQMPQMSRVRVGTAVAAVLAAMLAVPGAQSLQAQTLPASRPTSLPPGLTSGVPSGSALPATVAGQAMAGEASKPHHAQVTYVGRQLEIRADDSSLNQILRSITRRTGLKITGGVADQRVFGNYGPASTSQVLATLLDGTGTNILLLAGDATNPPELVLTPRNGGATPPSPDSSIYAAYDDDAPPAQPTQGNTSPPVQRQAPARSGPASIPQPQNNVNGSPSNTSPTASTLPTVHSVPLDSLPTPSTTPSTSGIVDAPNPPAEGSTTGSAPNGTQPQSGQSPH